jgi:hypothetical protein
VREEQELQQKRKLGQWLSSATGDRSKGKEKSLTSKVNKI